MHLDAADLKQFHFQSRLGRLATKTLSARVAEIWPSVAGMSVAGFGFASPLLKEFRTQASCIVNLMPAQQGAHRWPSSEGNRSVLTADDAWPLPTDFCERILIMHGLETSESPSGLLKECRRVLAPEGRILILVPNRAGLWARSEATPFGFGRPYSSGQLDRQLQDHRLEPVRHSAALYFPPSERRFLAGASGVWEKIGSGMPMGFASGVLIVEAVKRVMQPIRPALAEKVTSSLKALEEITVPGAKPVSGREPVGFGRFAGQGGVAINDSPEPRLPCVPRIDR